MEPEDELLGMSIDTELVFDIADVNNDIESFCHLELLLNC
jgi:hypothetical protein